MEMETKKNKVVEGVLIILIVILSLGALGYYYISSFKTKTLIEKSAAYIKNVANIIEFDSSDSLDILNNDYKFEGNYKINTTSEELSFINNLELITNTYISINEEFINGYVTIKQSNASLNTSISLDSLKLYLSNSEIYKDVLSYNLPTNIFKSIKAALNEDSNISKNDLNYIINKTVDYIVESLDEAEIKTKYKGLTVEHKIIITKEQAKKMKEKFNSLVKNDEKLSKYYNIRKAVINEYEANNFNELDGTQKIIVRQNIINKSIESFEISNSDGKVVGEKDSNGNFTVKNNGELLLTIKKIKESYELEFYEDSKATSKCILKLNENNFSINITDNNNTNVTLSLKKINGEDLNIEMLAKTSEFNMNLNFDLKVQNETTTMEGILNAKMNGYDLKVSFNEKCAKLNEKITKKNYTKVKDIEKLTEEQLNEIMNNLESAISKFDFYKTLISTIENSGLQYSIE